MGLMEGAVSGWQNFIKDGKYPVLLLGVLLYLWGTVRQRRRKKELAILCYATVTAILVICPVTAVILMKYQTRFYDYPWVWSIVPMTLVIAYGGTLLYTDFREKWSGGSRWKTAGWAALGIAVLILCSNLVPENGQTAQEAAKAQKAAAVMDYLTEAGKNKDIVLWGPRELLQYARASNGDITLLYGRNMWEEALGAYSYDTYDAELIKLYEWMESLEQANGAGTDDSAAQRRLSAEMSVEAALEHGVNTILVPENVSGEMAALIGELLGQGGMTAVEPDSVMGYLVFRI